MSKKTRLAELESAMNEIASSIPIEDWGPDVDVDKLCRAVKDFAGDTVPRAMSDAPKDREIWIVKPAIWAGRWRKGPTVGWLPVPDDLAPTIISKKWHSMCAKIIEGSEGDSA